MFTAHLDHLGIGKPINGDAIYNGAMDNASGIAAMLDVAAMLKESGTKLRRSLLFVAVTGEEKGLLGSKFFANSPTVDREAIVADINTDMFLPLFPLKKLTIYGMDESDLGGDAAAVAESLGIEPQRDQDPKRNIFIRSDQYSFIRRGVPALALKVGFDKGSPEEQVQKKWLTRALPCAVGRRCAAGGQAGRRRVRRAGREAARASRQPPGTAALEGLFVLQAVRIRRGRVKPGAGAAFGHFARAAAQQWRIQEQRPPGLVSPHALYVRRFR